MNTRASAVVTTVVAAVLALVVGNVVGQEMSRGAYFNRPAPALVLLVAIAIMVPVTGRIWQRSTVQLSEIAAFVAAFLCLWTAAGSSTKTPFTADQWYLLGATLVAIGGTLTWRRSSSGLARRP